MCPIVMSSPYPHNLFLEIASEFGFVGLILMATVVIQYLIMNRSELGCRLKNGFIPFIIFLPYFIHSIGDGLDHNIVVFILLFFLFNYNQRLQKPRKRVLQPSWGWFISVKHVKTSDEPSEGSN